MIVKIIPLLMLVMLPLNENKDFSRAVQAYRNNCMACHGANLEGGIGPNLQRVGSRKTKEDIVSIITYGRGLMPSYGNQLDRNTIQLLAKWLAAKR